MKTNGDHSCTLHRPLPPQTPQRPPGCSAAAPWQPPWLPHPHCGSVRAPSRPLAADGRYRFRTIRPAAYGSRTPHIHVKVRLGQHELLTTQLYVTDDPGNPRDFLWRRLNEADRAALTVPFTPGSDGLRASFPIVVDV